MVLAPGAVVLVLGAAVAGCSTAPLVAGAPARPPAGSSASPSVLGQPPAHTATVPLGSRRSAELDVVSGATSISVGTARLGGELLRVQTPANSGVRPDLVTSGGTGQSNLGQNNTGQNNTVQLYLDSTGGSGPAAVQVVLNSGVAWQLLFAGGASQTDADLGTGRLAGADFAAGSNLITMTLPRPSGTVTVRLAGGASQVTLGLPANVPAQLQLDGGASTATLFGRTTTGIGGGTVLTSPGWAQATNRYLVTAPAGLSSIDVTG